MTLLDIQISLPKDTEFRLAWLTDCELLSETFKSPIIEIKSNEPGHPRRLVKMRGYEFTEQLTHISETKLTYQIVGDGPIKRHQGQIDYMSTTDKHYLRYKIQGHSNTWIPNRLLKIVMFYDFKLAGKRLRKLLSER